MFFLIVKLYIVRSHVLNLFSFNSEIQKKRKFEIAKWAPTSCKSKEIKTMHLPKEKRTKRPAIGMRFNES
jgi:hypothetical protein